MIDFSKIVGFQWDAGNDRKSEDEHRVFRSEAEQVFFNDPLLVFVDGKHSEHEARYHALGRSDDDRALIISFTLRANDTLIRVVSARDMNRKERKLYEH